MHPAILIRRTGSSVELLGQVCTMEEWAQGSHSTCARHPDGFLVFVPPNGLADSDEYADDDPYSLEANLGSVFNQNRLHGTLTAIRGLLPVVGTKARVLDVGCGVGVFSQHILKAFPEFELHGLDYSLSAIRNAQALLPKAHLVVASAYEPPYVDDYFDIALCNNIWEHVPDPLRMLSALRRVIRPGGFVIISTPNRYRIENLVRIIRGKPVTLMSVAHITEYSVGQVHEQLAGGGFVHATVSAPPYIAKTGRLAKRIVASVLNLWLRANGSHHTLEPTLFFVAQKAVDFQD